MILGCTMQGNWTRKGKISVSSFPKTFGTCEIIPRDQRWDQIRLTVNIDLYVLKWKRKLRQKLCSLA